MPFRRRTFLFSAKVCGLNRGSDRRRAIPHTDVRPQRLGLSHGRWIRGIVSSGTVVARISIRRHDDCVSGFA